MRKTFIKALSLVMTMTISVSAMIMPISADFEKTDKGTKYSDESGKYVTGWQTIGQNKYYFTEDGIMKTGLLKTKTATYCFYKSGKMVISSWITLGKNKYYFGADGKAKTGTVIIGSKQYTFDKSGVWNKEQGLYVQKYVFGNTNWGDTVKEIMKREKAEEFLTNKSKDVLIINYVKVENNSYSAFCGFNKNGGLISASLRFSNLENIDDYISEYNTMFQIFESQFGDPFYNCRTGKISDNKYMSENAYMWLNCYDKYVACWETSTSTVQLSLMNVGEPSINILYVSKEYLDSVEEDSTESD